MEQYLALEAFAIKYAFLPVNLSKHASIITSSLLQSQIDLDPETHIR